MATEAGVERPVGGATRNDNDNDNPAGAEWLVGGGELGALIRARDWHDTPLGPVERWPQSLRSAVSILLPSKAQICLFWGPELIAIYNDAYRPVLGIKHPRALGLPVREMWSEFWEDVLRPLFEGVLRTGEAFWASDHPFALERHGYPEETYFDISYDPVRDESGGVGGVFCIVSETTGRVVGERRLRALSALGRVAPQASATDGVYRHAGEVLRADVDDIPFALLYECDARGESARLREAVGIDPGHPLARAHAGPLARSLAIGPALPSEGIVVEADSLGLPPLPGGRWPEPCTRLVVLPIAAASQAPEGFLVAGTSPRRPLDAGYRDYLRLVATAIANALSGVRALESERRRSQALAELDRAKTMFFGNISHEFRTPLTLLLGPLREELAGEALPAAARARLEMAYRNGLRLLKLVNALLDFSRIEAGRMSARFEPTDLAQLTAELASNFESACARAGLELRVRCEPLPQPAFVDREMWEKIVLNLLSNAFKFTFEGSIEVRLAESGGRALLTVRDTGVGIPPASMPRLFERFHRVEGVRSRTHEGSGIGLAMVHELVRLHGGEIRAESEPGAGTTFEIALPLGHAHLPQDQVANAPSTGRASSASFYVQEMHDWLRLPDSARLPDVAPAAGSERARILVVDDNADMREYIERLLGAHWEVNVAEDGEIALRALFTSRYDLVLTDVMMPRMDGFALLRAIRSEPSLRQLPVLMLSARAGEESRIEGLDAGADDYLVKPFSGRELVAQVRAQLAMAQARRLTAREREVLLAGEREARMDLQRHWEDLVELFEKAPNPMVILRGPEHVVELANAAACEVWGRKAAEVLQRPLFEALPEAAGQGLEQLLQVVLASGQAHQGRELPVTLVRGGGPETVYFDFVYSPLRSQSGRIDRVAVTAFDVTERVRLRQHGATRVPS